MYMSYFGEFLRKTVFARTSRTDLLVKLQLEYAEFNGLDNITLSRWVNGVTTPSLNRQILIAKASDSLFDFLSNCPEIKVPTAIKNKYNNYLNQFDSIYHSIDHCEHMHKYYYFKGPNLIGRDIYAHYMNKLNVNVTVKRYFKLHNMTPVVEVFYRAKEPLSRASSFVCMSINTHMFLEAIGFDKKEIASLTNGGALFINLSFFRCSNDYKDIFGLLLNHIIFNHLDLHSVIMVARGRDSMMWFETIGAEQVKLIEHSTVYGNIYLYKISLSKLLGIPVVLSSAIEKLGLYTDCFERLQSKEMLLHHSKELNKELKV